MISKLLSFMITISLVVLSGCTDYGADDAWPAGQPLGQEFQTYKPPSEAPLAIADSPAVAEPNGVLTLRQALALALMYNPELRAFSWEVRGAEARQLQAGLLPNPKLELEVEEVGGPGGRSGFDGAETT
ncbi:MAG: TolC family protein, partial [Planctomycetota bacterium]